MKVEIELHPIETAPKDGTPFTLVNAADPGLTSHGFYVESAPSCRPWMDDDGFLMTAKVFTAKWTHWFRMPAIPTTPEEGNG